MSILPNISNWKYSKFIKNNKYFFKRKYVLKIVSSKILKKAYKVVSSWKGYKPTPLISLTKLNNNLNLNNIFYKDESKRFHLKSFKALGGAFAVEQIASKQKNIIISSATAGNHGRSVAWGAQRLGLNCKIFVSEYVSNSRVKRSNKLIASGS